MPLNIRYDTDDDRINALVGFLGQRLYVARSLVPEGYEPYFREQARFISVHTSTAIEGNPLSDEAAMIVLVERTGDEPNELEKLNLDEAYELMDLLAADKAMRIDQGIIRTFNSIVLRGLPGRAANFRGMYRRSTSAIVDAQTREVRYLPPPPAQVPELMAGFVDSMRTWIDLYDGAIAAALTHFGLISIHPFEDGNGRTARLIADMVLRITGSSADGMVSISKVIRDQIGAYYDALRDAQGKQFLEDVDVTPFVLFHTNALCDSAIELEEKVIAFNKRKDQLIRNSDGLLNKRQVTGMMFMFDIGPLSSSVYARLTEASQSSAISDLAYLVNEEFAIREGTGKRTRYRVNPAIVPPPEDHVQATS